MGCHSSKANGSVEFVNTAGERVEFKIEDGVLNFYLNGFPKVREMTSLRLSGCTLFFDGTSAGQVGSNWRITARTARDAQPVLALFEKLKAPAAPAAAEANEANFSTAKTANTLLTSNGIMEAKKASMKDSTTEQQPLLQEVPETNPEVTDDPATDLRSTETSNENPESKGQATQPIEKPEREASGQEPEIPSGNMAEPLAPEASRLAHGPADAAAARAALEEIKKAEGISEGRRVEGSPIGHGEAKQTKKDIVNARPEAPGASMANSTSPAKEPRKEKGMCCC